MSEQTFVEAFEELRLVLESKRLPCPHPLEEVCECGKDGWLGQADPAYAPLLTLMKEDCPDCLLKGTVGSDRCRGMGNIPRTAYWEAAPNGALAGALGSALMELDQSVLDYVYYERLLFICERFDDLDAVKAVLEWAKEQPRMPLHKL